jgi:hypothetical protein
VADLHRAVVVAVLVAGVMKVAVHEVVDVVPMRNGGVLARRPVLVVGGVPTAGVRWCATGGIDRVHVERMTLDGSTLDVIEATVVNVVLVAPVADARVPAPGPVRVELALMTLVVAHCRCPHRER